MDFYIPTTSAYGEWSTPQVSDGELVNPTGVTYQVDIIRGTGKHRAAQISMNSGDNTQIDILAHYYAIEGLPYTASTKSGVDLVGATIPDVKFGAWVVTHDTIDNETVTAAADNATGYATAALARTAAEAAAPSGEYIDGFVIIENSGGTFVPATTELDAGTVTATFECAAELEGVAEGALTEESIGTGVMNLWADIALLGGGASAGSQDKVIIRYLTAATDITLDNLPVVIFGVAIDGLSTGVSSDVQAQSNTAADVALKDFHGSYTVIVQASPTPTVTTFGVNVNVGTEEMTGFIRALDGALAGESRPAKHTGTTITIEGAHANMPTNWKEFTAAPASGVTMVFTPIS